MQELSSLQVEKQILRKLISQVRRQVDMTLLIQCLQAKHPKIKITPPPTPPPPPTPQEWNPRRIIIQKIIKAMEQNATALHIEEQSKLLCQAKIEGDKPTINAIK